MTIASSLIGYLKSTPENETGKGGPRRRRRPVVKPVGVVWGIDERPPAYVLWIAALQHVLLATVATTFPLVVLDAVNASHETVEIALSASLLAIGITSLLFSYNGRDIGVGALMPAAFSGIYYSATLLAAHQGGLPLVAGMTIFAGLVQLAIGRMVHLLRPYLPTEIAGFAMLMSGVTMGLIGFNQITGVATAVDAMSTRTGPGAELGGACLLATVGLFVWGAASIRLYVVLIVLAGGYAAGAAMGFVPFAEMRSAATLIHLPLPLPAWPTFATNLMLPFAIAALAASLRAIGDFSTLQKINDANWQRPDMQAIRRGLVTNGIGTMIGGALGAVPISPSSASLGLSVATGVNSRVVGYASGAIFIVLAFLPAAHELIILAPRPVLGAAMAFAGCFVVVNGMQAMVSRLMDGRRTLVAALALLLAFTRFLFPTFYADAPDWLAPAVASPQVIGIVAALFLNAAFRIGIHRTATIEFTPGVDPLDKLEQFAERQGGIWGARRDVIDKAGRAMIELGEALELLVEPGKSARVQMRFDEYWLDVVTKYPGKPLVASGQAPSHEELLADDSQLTRLAAVMIRRQTTRLATATEGKMQRIKLGFEH